MSTINRQNLLPHLQQALNMLDLNPENELNRYRRYKKGELDAVRTFESAELIERPGGVGPLNRPFSVPDLVQTTEDDDDEEYEMIPPSQSFAVYENKTNDPSTAIQSTDLDNEMPGGEMILTGQLPENDSLSVRIPGAITPREEYLPASQDLMHSLSAAPTPPEVPVPKWKMPLAIGSSVVAMAAVGGMSYVNMHPTLLKGVPGIAQLTATPILPVVPPGQALQGPDLAMGEFSELSLSNINSLTVPGTEIVQANPNQPPILAATSAPGNPALPQPIIPNAGVATTAPSPAGNLADGLIRNLLPPSIQQLSGQPSPAVNPMVNQYYSRPSAAASNYAVFAQPRSPRSLAKIQSLVPKAKMQGDRVFLGNFVDEAAADKMVKQMQDQGFKASAERVSN